MTCQSVQRGKVPILLNYNIGTQVGQASPSAYLTNLNTQYIGQTKTNGNISIKFSITTGEYLQTYTSVKQYSMGESKRQDFEAQIELEADRLVLVRHTSQKVLDIRKAAGHSRRLDVELNHKSLCASVRSATNFLIV